MKQYLFATVLCAVLLASLAALVLRPSTHTSTEAVKGDSLIQPITAREILDQVRSRKSPVTLINFWASWCEPCKQEFPYLLSLRKKLGAQGLDLIFVSIDEATDLDAAAAFLREQHVDFATYYKGSQSLEFVTQIYPKWEGAVPTTLLMGPDLKLLDSWEGDASLGEFTERVMRQLKVSGT